MKQIRHLKEARNSQEDPEDLEDLAITKDLTQKLLMIIAPGNLEKTSQSTFNIEMAKSL
jgi:hypothetical protein